MLVFGFRLAFLFLISFSHFFRMFRQWSWTRIDDTTDTLQALKVGFATSFLLHLVVNSYRGI
jgi:hypothetical protein